MLNVAEPMFIAVDLRCAMPCGVIEQTLRTLTDHVVTLSCLVMNAAVRKCGHFDSAISLVTILVSLCTCPMAEQLRLGMMATCLQRACTCMPDGGNSEYA